MTSPFIEALSLMPRDEPIHDNVLEDVMLDSNTTLKIGVAVTVVGWLIFGLISCLTINSGGKAGRFVPEWYIKSNKKGSDKLAVTGWWIGILLFWPIIWMVYLIRAAEKGVGKCFGLCKWMKRDSEKELV
ncbi:hypothetical protein FSARC_14326 [Fusarium sarcochroum]|uniref:Uncharacterized protein n=1 Tax=Fusarium sarcochroum TaxID=1208366 RepID=A0A8H4SUC7_9HYPO|nr:hypothetical protein FSARC_14326 [Fusarium sarcochroum]